MLKQKFILHFSSGIIGQILTALTGIIVARWAGPKIVGTVAYGVAYVSVFSFIVGLLGSSHLKLVSEGQDQGNCIKTFYVLQTICIVVFAVVFCVWILVQTKVLKHTFQREQLIVIWIYFLFFVVSQILSMWQMNFSATINIAKNSIPYLLQNLCVNVTRIFVVLTGFGAIALTAANFSGLLVAMPITWHYSRKLPKGHFDRMLSKKYLSITMVFFIITACGALMTNLGRIVLERFSSLTEVGLFSAGSSIAAMLLLIASTTGTIFFPLFSKLTAENHMEKINLQIGLFERIILIFLAPVIVLISVFSPYIIKFFLGTQFYGSEKILEILAVTAFFQIVTLPHGNLLAGRGWFKVLSYLNIGQLVIFIIFMFVFLDKRLLGLGGTGLAWATLLSNLFIAAGYVVISNAKAGVNTLKTNKRYFLYAAGFYLIMTLILKVPAFGFGISMKLLIAFILLSIYFIILIMIKWLSRDDIALIIDFINPHKLFMYIKSEM